MASILFVAAEFVGLEGKPLWDPGVEGLGIGLRIPLFQSARLA